MIKGSTKYSGGIGNFNNMAGFIIVWPEILDYLSCQIYQILCSLH